MPKKAARKFLLIWSFINTQAILLRKLQVFSKLNTSYTVGWHIKHQRGGVWCFIFLCSLSMIDIYKWHRQITLAWGSSQTSSLDFTWQDFEMKLCISKISLKYCTAVINHCLFRNKDIFYINMQRIQNQHQTNSFGAIIFLKYWKNILELVHSFVSVFGFTSSF